MTSRQKRKNHLVDCYIGAPVTTLKHEPFIPTLTHDFARGQGIPVFCLYFDAQAACYVMLLM